MFSTGGSHTTQVSGTGSLIPSAIDSDVAAQMGGGELETLQHTDCCVNVWYCRYRTVF